MGSEQERTFMTDQELLRLAYAKIASAEKLLTMAGETLLAEEAEALAQKVGLAKVARPQSPFTPGEPQLGAPKAALVPRRA
jgi:hypothetical protein